MTYMSDMQAAEDRAERYALYVCLTYIRTYIHTYIHMQAAEDRAEARQTSCASRFLSGARRGLTKRTEVHATMSAGCNP